MNEAPVLRPTMQEFEDFEAFISSVHSLGMRHGIVKVQPPPEWLARQPALFGPGEGCSSDLTIPTPIEQNLNGALGVFELILVEKRKMHLSKFQQAAALAQEALGEHWVQAVAGGDSEAVEKSFWRGLQYGTPPMYGADMIGSMFSVAVPCWHLDKLDTILQRLLAEEHGELSGVLNSYLYWGMARAFFGVHCEGTPPVHVAWPVSRP